MKYVPLNSVISENQKEAYLADAYFLRALYYSQMVAMWGPIPYNAEPINSINNNPVNPINFYKDGLSEEEYQKLLEASKDQNIYEE